MANLSQEEENYARDDGYESLAETFESLLYGAFGSQGLIPNEGKPGRLIKARNPGEEARVRVCVANGMMALIAQVYLENGQSAAQTMMDFSTILHHVETGWSGPDDGKKPTNLRVIHGEKKT
jgi:hypothetical protein